MVTETVTMKGHIIDSLIFAKVLDTILQFGGTFDISKIEIGTRREDPTMAKISIQAESPALLERILQAIQPHGAVIEKIEDCITMVASKWRSSRFVLSYFTSSNSSSFKRAMGRCRGY